MPRWVARPQNVGDAITQGLELEAKFRLSDVMADAPPLELRSNAELLPLAREERARAQTTGSTSSPT